MKKILLLIILLFSLNLVYSTNYYVDINHANADDSNDCLSIDNPCFTINAAKKKMVMEMKSNPDNITLFIREGIYRLPYHGFTSSLNVDGDENNFFTIQNYPGEKVQIFGSLNTSNQTWELYNSSLNIWRTSADFLFVRDPTGMFLGDRRISHLTDTNGGRNHQNAWNLSNENHWTKAYENGSQCFKDNLGCYIYLIPKDGNNPNAQVYELAQRGLGIINSDYIQVKGLEFYYTQATPIYFNGADYILLENNIFAHTSNGNDNSYAVHLWNSQGSIIRNNTVYDSQYWGGTANSKGITVMINKIGDPNIIENNHIYDIPGSAAVGSKGGDHSLIVRNNYIHDVVYAFAPVGFRCAYSDCEVTNSYRPGGDWQIYNNIIVNANQGLYLYVYEDNHHHSFHDNLVINATVGVSLFYNKSFNNTFYNNIFINNEYAIFLVGTKGAEVPEYYGQYTSDYNLFFNNTNAYLHKKNPGSKYFGTRYNFSTFSFLFGRENNSISGNPQLSFNYVPDKNSIVCGAGKFGDDIGPIDCSDRKLDFESPSKVSNLNYSFISNSSINLNWTEATDNIQVEAYQILRDNSIIAQTNKTFYIDSNLQSNTTYLYKVRAYDNSMNLGLFSSELSYTTPTFSFSVSCQENWSYDNWGSCLKGEMTRSAFDSNNCGTTIERLPLTQTCSIDPPKKTGGGSSGGGSSSSYSSSDIENIDLNVSSCISNYEYHNWSICENGKQTQFIEDLNDCDGDILEERICQKELSEEENLLLNAKKIDLDNLAPKKYKAKLEYGYNEIFYVEEKLDEDIFIFQDESTSQEYYGQYYSEVEGKYYYTLKRVDEGIVTILQEEGILDNLLIEDDKTNFLVLTSILIVLILCVISTFVVYLRKK